MERRPLRQHRGGSTRVWDSTCSSQSESSRHPLMAVLKRVSRSFYLSVRVLPSGMREPVALAYLLARAADTIADTPSTPTDCRLAHLNEFRRILAENEEIEAASSLSAALAELQPLGAERTLLGMLPTVLVLLRSLEDSEAESVRSVVMTLTSGMLFDLNTFGSDERTGITALNSAEQLDEYCYLIAGCVGEFWTDTSIAHTPSLSSWDADEMRALGMRFGLALQMTNILRDLPKDLRMGRCYLPESELQRRTLAPDDLLCVNNFTRARTLLTWGIRRTLDHYTAAESYILAIPRRNLRLRLAALWPVLIGLETLAKLTRNEKWLDPSVPTKIPRRQVYGIIALSLLCGRSNSLSGLWIRRIRRRIEQSL